MARARVLVVEDDEEFLGFYRCFSQCHAREFAWTLAKTGGEALAALSNHARAPIDVALLDWTLEPGSMNGLQILRHIRSNPATRSIMAFMVTANTRERDMDAAWEAGADDYITKPFRERELLNRLRGRLRSRELTQDAHKLFELCGLSLDIQNSKVLLRGKALGLYPTELELLKLFLKRPDSILSPGCLWESVRGYPSKNATLVLSKHISNLRKKLGTWGRRLETVRNQGYLLNTRLPLLEG